MTCLYCGKKLGFFSRYKDTPFCTEEHLRSHQDELERALLERLGSKAGSLQAGKIPIEAPEETIQDQAVPTPPRPNPVPAKAKTPIPEKKTPRAPAPAVEAKPAERRPEPKREKPAAQTREAASEKSTDPAPLY